QHSQGPLRRKRMKFSKFMGLPAAGLRRRGVLSGFQAKGVLRRGGVGQLLLISATGLLVAAGLAACQLVTIDYVFVASSASTSSGPKGQIDTFAADSQSGALRKGAATVSSGGVDPVAMAVSADYTNLYVAHAGDNTVVHFAVAPNGVLTAKDTL